jgi:NTP pyrophosphatase (non-canonical NTP hydrolase)
MGQITELQKICHNIAREKGFWRANQDFLNKLMLVVSELGECAEAYRTDSNKEAIVEELADAVIRILDLCGYRELNLEEAILKKIKRNKTRPHLHGKLC